MSKTLYNILMKYEKTRILLNVYLKDGKKNNIPGVSKKGNPTFYVIISSIYMLGQIQWLL